jgi:threonine synthase
MTAFVSTRGQAHPVSLRDALLAGLAPDGGLYVPARTPVLERDAWDDLRGRSLPEIGLAMASAWFGDEIPEADLARLLRGALTFDTPLVMVQPGLWALELFHGPTLAFKDIGARVMARLLSYFQVGRETVTVLVATSGDTGGAVAQAFHGVPGTRVVVLYPAGRVSPVQEAQFTTLGGNVTAVAVSGTFDDCQRLVKEAFASPELGRRLRLTSANSINIGRLLPQAFYYASAALTFPHDRPPLVSVPSGNFGNLTAGLLAWKMGVPIARFIAATTVNDVVPRYLATGRVEPRQPRSTLATAMDVGNPSNLERIRWLFDDEVDDLRRMVSGSVQTDDAVRDAILKQYRQARYVCDPHTAIAYLGLATRPGSLHDEREPPGVFLATAHPAKFPEVVEPIIGEKLPIPPLLAESLAKERAMEQIAPELTALTRIL